MVGVAQAETRTEIASSGAWTLLRVQEAQIVVAGRASKVPVVCMVEATSGGVLVRFVVEPRQDRLVTILASNGWDFGSGSSLEAVIMEAGTFRVVYQNPDAVRNSISHDMGPDTGTGMLYLAAMQGDGVATFTDMNSGREYARVPFKGFSAVVDKLESCLGY